MTSSKSQTGVRYSMIPLAIPNLGGNEWKYLKDCLDTNWVSSVGSYVTRFEQMAADYTGNSFAVATSSGTAALHVALLAAGVGVDDEVLVSTMTFIAPANAIRYVGAWPVFIDAEPDYWQMDPGLMVQFLENECETKNSVLYNKRTGRRIKAVLPVHILGHPCDMRPIVESARKYGLSIIEDATESLGAKYENEPVGHLGDIACLSFNGNKLMTSGGGGLVLTDREDWAERVSYLTTQSKDDPIEYIHNEIGFNYRLTNIQAAIGCAQLEKVDSHIESKLKTAAVYRERLENIYGLTPMNKAPWADSVFWMFTALVDQNRYGMSSRKLMKELDLQRIQTRPLWQPMHMSPAHAGSQAVTNGVAESLFQDALSLPCSVGITDEELERVIGALKSLANNTR